ncbi:DUF6281 family protein [Streptomyces sp. S.PNR 29]|uniref:DUF6281 family protein n=1 Tax=Streptomyces sp. S.PNR 29 TaxID=2973805 RepID=UPI0025AF9AE5|nr:DUF6281 family protein [Streptomyces sp. S.PNR 29]MDN0200574.1 DUF6281 family protein [Streptomyces sp. S.PNR 29]
MKALPLRGGRCPAWVLLATALSAACTSVPDGGGDAAPSCAYVVEYDSRRYMGWAETDLPVGESLGGATRPACDDTPDDGDDGEGPTLTTAFAVRGVDPNIAIAVAEDPGEYRLAVVDHVKELPPELRKLIEQS